MRPADITLDELLRAEPDVLHQKALRLRHGDGVTQDLATARRMFGLAALYGHSASRYQLGLMNAKGEGGDKHAVRALMWFRLASGRDEPRAAAQVQRLSNELTREQVRQAEVWVAEGERARHHFTLARRDADGSAMAALGRSLFQGVGAEPDAELAVHWLRQAAVRDDPDAQLMLGQAYAEGRGVPRNPDEAQRWFRLAASQGLIEANYHWAACLEQSYRERSARIQAIELYDIAARHGHLHAQLRLGQLFKGGEVEPVAGIGTVGAVTEFAPAQKKQVKASHSPNLVCALQYFAMAAAQGQIDAQFELGQMYAQGQGTTQQFEQAVNWYERAAQQGHAKAQFNLAFMLAHGQGVEENLLKAYEWYRISHLCGYALAKQSMENTAKKLPPGEIEMADWRADSFVHRLQEASH